MSSNDLIPCPHCGEPPPRDAIACRECGSDAETGWLDGREQDYLSVELPEVGGEVIDTTRKGRTFKMGILLFAGLFALWATGWLLPLNPQVRDPLLALGLVILFYNMVGKGPQQR